MPTAAMTGETFRKPISKSMRRNSPGTKKRINLYDYLMTFHGALFSALEKALDDGTVLENSPSDENLVRDRLMLRRSYYQLVLAMFNSNLGEIFQIEAVFKFFVKDMLYVLSNETDPSLLKTAFHVIRRTMEVWNNQNYQEVAFKTFVPPFFNCLKNGLLFDTTDSSFSSAGDEAVRLIIFLHKQNANILEQKLRTELLFGRPETDINNFIHLFQTNPKGDLKIFRQYLELLYKSARNSNHHDVRTV